MVRKLDVEKADLSFEAGFVQPEFALLRDPPGLLRHLFLRLEPHGLRLGDMRIERGTGNVSDFHVLCYLFNYWMTVRIRVERVDVFCSELPQDHVQRFGAAITDTLRAVQDHSPSAAFRAFALAAGFHGRIEGQAAKEYLGRFISSVPSDLGPSLGGGAVFYFGPEGDRLLSTITVDMSAVVPEAVYIRTHFVWDAKKVRIEALPSLGEESVRQVVNRLELELAR